MAGRKPDFDVTIPVNFEANGEQKTRWHNVGAGWRGESGKITFTLVTNPGVHYPEAFAQDVLCERQEKSAEKPSRRRS